MIDFLTIVETRFPVLPSDWRHNPQFGTVEFNQFRRVKFALTDPSDSWLSFPQPR